MFRCRKYDRKQMKHSFLKSLIKQTRACCSCTHLLNHCKHKWYIHYMACMSKSGDCNRLCEKLFCCVETNLAKNYTSQSYIENGSLFLIQHPTTVCVFKNRKQDKNGCKTRPCAAGPTCMTLQNITVKKKGYK